MVGRNEISMANHQKKRVAGSSSCLPMSLHFLLLFVKRLAMTPMGHGRHFARILPAHSVSQTISSQMQNQTSSTPPTVALVNTKAPRSNGMRIIKTKGVIYVKYRTRKLDSWTLLKNFEIFVVGFSGGL